MFACISIILSQPCIPEVCNIRVEALLQCATFHSNKYYALNIISIYYGILIVHSDMYVSTTADMDAGVK
jgi:hypothetical protein